MAKSSTSTGDDNPVPYVCLAVFEGTVSGDALIGDDILVNQGRRQGGGIETYGAENGSSFVAVETFRDGSDVRDV